MTSFPAGTRRTWVVKKGFQFKILALTLAAAGVAIAVIGVDLFTSFGRHTRDFSSLGNVSLIYREAMVVFIIRAFLYLGGILGVTLYFSHKIAGPMYRLEKSAGRIAAGDLTGKVQLRKGDELSDFRDVFNAMLESLNVKVSADVAAARKVKDVLLEISEDASVSPVVSRRAREAAVEIEKIGQGFKLI